MLLKKNRSAVLQKKLIRLRVNPINNNKFLKLVLESVKKKTISVKIADQAVRKEIILRRFAETPKPRKKKWESFQRNLAKKNNFFQKYKPYSFFHYDVSNLASQGNAFKKNFRKDLFTKKIFDHFYGGFKKDYLKKQMTKLYRTNQKRDPRNSCAELFESRLDSVLWRARFCLSIKDARQLVSHGHICVNGGVEKNFSYVLQRGDLIQVKTKKIVTTKLDALFKERFDSILWPILPTYINVRYTTFEIIFGNALNFDFSPLFCFKNDFSKVVESHYRH